MPQQQEKQQRKTTAAPTRGLLSRMFGSEPLTPEMQQGIDIAKKEIPDLAPVEPYGLFNRTMLPSAMGTVSPSNKIYLNPAQAGQSPQDWADTVVHEQEHVNQQKAKGYGPTRQFLSNLFENQGLPYGQRPDELAAFQVEKERRARMNRSQAPSFTNPGQFYTPSDVRLPVEKKEVTPTLFPVTDTSTYIR